MSKDNLFLGMARGKVGDIVFYRQDGQQITRTRNRAPRNPKTQKQLVQRAIMATVGLAYKFGSSIFDHAFQGKTVGAQCQREFISENLRILRGLMATEANGVVANPQARVVGPKSIAPVPFGGMMISRGTYDQNLFSWTDGLGVNLTAASMPSTLDSEETGAEYASRVGLIPNDLYTFVLFPISSSHPIFEVQGSGTWRGIQYPASFNFVRLRVKDLSEVSTPADDLTYDDIFTIEATNVNTANLKANRPGDDVDMETLFSVGYDNMGAFGIIRSRDDQDLRSTSYLHLAGSGNAFGLTAPWALPAWQQGSAEVVGSSLILEGGSLDGDSTPFEPPTTYLESLTEFQDNNMESTSYGKYLVYGQDGNGVKKMLVDIGEQTQDGYVVHTYSFSANPSASAPDSGELYRVETMELTGVPPTNADDVWQACIQQAAVDGWTDLGITTMIFVSDAVAQLYQTTGVTYNVHS